MGEGLHLRKERTMTAIGNGGLCPHCGMGHGAVCPRIKAVEYHADGTIKRVEYFDPPQVALPSTMPVFGTGYISPRTT